MGNPASPPVRSTAVALQIFIPSSDSPPSGRQYIGTGTEALLVELLLASGVLQNDYKINNQVEYTSNESLLP